MRHFGAAANRAILFDRDLANLVSTLIALLANFSNWRPKWSVSADE